MRSSLLSVWRLDSVIKCTTASKYSPQYQTCPDRLDLPGPDPSGACSGCARRTLTVSRSISRTFIPGPLFSIILVTYCFTASVTFMAATQKLNDKKRSGEKPTAAQELWRKPAELMLRKHRGAFTSGSLTSSARPRHAAIQIQISVISIRELLHESRVFFDVLC